MKKFLNTFRKNMFLIIRDFLLPNPKQKTCFIIDTYVRIILLLYPLYNIQYNKSYFLNEKAILYYLLTILSIIFYIYYNIRNKYLFKKPLRPMDFFLICVLLLLLFNILNKSDYNFGLSLFLCCLIFTYYLSLSITGNYNYYIILFLFDAIYIYIGMFIHYLTGTENTIGISIIFQIQEGIASWLILITSLSSLLFCIVKNKKWQVFYLFMAVIGYILVFFYGDTITICLVFGVLLIIPIIFSPTVILVKKALILCFLFIFGLSNISWLQYIKFIYIDVQYSLLYSIYIELLLGIMGLYIYRYWGKIPKGINPDKIIMKKFQHWYKKILALFVIVLFSCILLGNKINDLPNMFGASILKKFCEMLLKSIETNISFFEVILINYGLIGYLVWVFLIIMISKRLIKQWRDVDIIIVRIFIIISALFIIQTFFYQLQPISSPMYIIFLSFALGADKIFAYENNVDTM